MMVRDFHRDGPRCLERADEGRRPCSPIRSLPASAASRTRWASSSCSIYRSQGSSVAMIGVEAGGHQIDRAACTWLNGHRPGSPPPRTRTVACCKQGTGQIQQTRIDLGGAGLPGPVPAATFSIISARNTYAMPPGPRHAGGVGVVRTRRGHHPGFWSQRPHSHAPRWRALPRDHLLVMNVCSRGNKDIFAVADHLGVTL